jgi:predicted membrane channel-forming protein YqfA (hemolysin III family)
MGPKPEDFEGRWWIFNGVVFGLFMLVILELILPLIKSAPINWVKLVTVGFPIYLLGGLIYAFIMKLYFKYL